MPNLFALQSQRRLRWLGLVRRMKDGRFPKDILYGDLPLATDPPGRAPFSLKMSANVTNVPQTGSINPENWETQGADRSSWTTVIRTSIRTNERRRREESKDRKKQMAETTADALWAHNSLSLETQGGQQQQCSYVYNYVCTYERMYVCFHVYMCILTYVPMYICYMYIFM